MQAGERVARHLDHRMAELQQQVETDTVKLFVGHGAAFRTCSTPSGCDGI